MNTETMSWNLKASPELVELGTLGRNNTKFADPNSVPSYLLYVPANLGSEALKPKIMGRM